MFSYAIWALFLTKQSIIFFFFFFGGGGGGRRCTCCAPSWIHHCRWSFGCTLLTIRCRQYKMLQVASFERNYSTVTVHTVILQYHRQLGFAWRKCDLRNRTEIHFNQNYTLKSIWLYIFEEFQKVSVKWLGGFTNVAVIVSPVCWLVWFVSFTFRILH